MRKFLMPAALLATGLLVLGACGSSSSGAKKAKTGSTAQAASAPVTLSGQVTNKGTKDLAGATTVSLEADDNYFQPTFIKASPGETLTVQLKNEGKNTHTFTIDGAADHMLNPDQKATVTVTVPASGALNFYCRFHRSLGMQGAIYTAAGQAVNPAAGSGGAATSAPSATSTPSTTPATTSGSGSSGGSGSGY